MEYEYEIKWFQYKGYAKYGLSLDRRIEEVLSCGIPLEKIKITLVKVEKPDEKSKV